MNDKAAMQAIQRWMYGRGFRAGYALVVAMFGIFSNVAFAFDIFRTQADVSETSATSSLTAARGVPCRFDTSDLSASSRLHLDEAIDRALCNNPKTREAWANVKVEAANVGAAKAAYLPSVTANWQRIKDNSVTDITGHPALSSAYRSTVGAESVSLNWVLYDFGGRRAALTSARALLTAARANQDSQLEAVFEKTATDYYAAQAAVGKQATAVESERAARDSFDVAQTRVNRGIAAISDQLQAQTSYAQATFNRVKAESDLAVALGTLATDMGIRPDQQLILPDVDDGIQPDTEFNESVAALIDDVERQHPSVKAARAQRDAALEKVKQVRSQGLPNLNFVAKYSRNNQPVSLGLGEPQFPATGHDWYFGIQVQIPLFEGFGRSYQISAAKAQAEAQQYALDEAVQKVGLDVWTTYQTLIANGRNVGNTVSILDVAQRSFDAALKRYRVGVGSIVELLNAQSALADARKQRVQALTDWRAARLQLAARMGRLDSRDTVFETNRMSGGDEEGRP
ncbi:TolC family protein [Burkholderia cepacia]|uniref:TolC family protein n=1 Tax=Burkholderia cepacia TaxID=292 RepID=UPI002ABDA21E|nr:TolC family protein [Burkholderia cepacia]